MPQAVPTGPFPPNIPVDFSRFQFTLQQPSLQEVESKEQNDDALPVPAPPRIQSPKKRSHGAPSAEADDPNAVVSHVFPQASVGDYALRNRVRKALHEKVVALGLAHAAQEKADRWRVKAADGKLAKALATTAASNEVDYCGPLNKVEKEGIALALAKFVPPDPLADLPAIALTRLGTQSRLKDRAKNTISVFDFECALKAVGATFTDYEIAEAIGNLHLDRERRVYWPEFVRFLSLPYPDRDSLVDGQEGPYPATAPPVRPLYEGGALPPPRHAYVSKHPPPPPPGRQNSAWVYATDGLSKSLKPRIHVPWPVDLTQPDSPFWIAVNALESAVLREVKRRAEVEAATKDGGLGPTARAGNRFNLRRAFLFFDRRSKKGFSVHDLHLTCAELGLVDPPGRPHLPAGNSASLNTSLRASSSLLNTSNAELDEIFGRTSTSINASAGVDLAPSQPIGDEPSAELLAALSPRRRLVNAPTTSFLDSTDADVDARMVALTKTLLRPVSDADRADPQEEQKRGDTLDRELATASRALVVALFRRMHGESDPGTSGAPIGVRISKRDAAEGERFQRAGEAMVSEDQPLCQRPVPYNIFARWAAPLGTFLRELREKVQQDFLAASTIGGGAKDFDRAFARIDSNGDGVMSVAEFRVALGPIARMLTPTQEEDLIGYFDVDGSGKIDFKEFLGIMSGATASVAATSVDGEDE